MPREKAKVTKRPAGTAQLSSVPLDVFTNAIACRVVEKMHGAGEQSAPRQHVPTDAPFAGTPPPNKPQPPSTAEIVKLNHDRAAGILSRLIVLDGRLRNLPENGCATQGANPTTPGLNDFLNEEGSMLIEAHNVLTEIGSYLGIEI